jgi:hypothetical protein
LIIAGRRGLRRGSGATDGTDGATSQRADYRATAAAGKSTNDRAGAGANRGTTGGPLAGIIGVRA